MNAPYIPQQGETLQGDSFITARGGKGANQAVAAARLGGDVVMCGCIGDDGFGEEAIASLQKEGIDISHLRRIKNVSTGTAIIIIVEGNNRIILDKGANAYLTKKDIDETLETAKAGDIYLTQLENPIDVIGYGLKKAREKGMYVILNPAPANEEIMPYLGYCDLITPNETELELLGGREKLLQTVENLLVTLGREGFEIITKSETKKYPCMRVQVVDTTAAGDTLCGGMSVKIAEGKTLLESAKFGSNAASIACTRRGAQLSIPTKIEIEKIMLKNI